jgi:DNA-binding Lrp family transcriptional regulator
LTKAYLLINTEPNCEQEIFDELKLIPEVREAYTLQGVYDLLIDVETDDTDHLKDVIHRRIRRLDKVQSILTMIERRV